MQNRARICQIVRIPQYIYKFYQKSSCFYRVNGGETAGKIARVHDVGLEDLVLANNLHVCGFSYLPRQDGGTNGGIAAYEFHVSKDDHNGGDPVATGVFPSTIEKQEVAFNAVNT